MPYIHAHFSEPISQEKKESLKTRFGQATTCFPGKSERWLMVEFSDSRPMWFHGEKGPMAMVEVALFGKASEKACEEMTGELTRILSEELGLDPAWVYIKYSATDYWGWNGVNL